jgi:hypothetical protein
MIKIYSSLLAAIIALMLAGCNSEKNREIFEDFEGDQGVYMVKLPPSLFIGMLDSEADIKNEELGNIDFVKLLVFDEAKAAGRLSVDIVSEIREKFDKFGYDLAVQFSSSGNDISAYVLENDDYISDLMLLVTNQEGVLGLGISGRLDGKALMNFASEVDYEDLSEIIDIDSLPF